MQEYLTILAPLLVPLTTVVPLVGALVLVAALYTSWLAQPARVSVYGTLSTVAGVGLLVVAAARAPQLLTWAATRTSSGTFGTLPADAFSALLLPLHELLIGGAAAVATFVLVARLMGELLAGDRDLQIVSVAFAAYSATVIGLLARNAARIVALFVGASDRSGAYGQLPPLSALLGPLAFWGIGGVTSVLVVLVVWTVVTQLLRHGRVDVVALTTRIVALIICGVIVRCSAVVLQDAVVLRSDGALLATVPTMVTQLAGLLAWSIRGAGAVATLVVVYSLVDEWVRRGSIAPMHAVLRVVLVAATVALAVGAQALVDAVLLAQTPV